MIQTDFLIIGQGIAGTLLSFELMQHGKKVMVLDAADPLKASLVAGAVLNPMAGKHWSPSPQAGLFLPQAKATYQYLEKLLNISILQEANMHVFHESEAKRLHFEQQQQRFPDYLSIIPDPASPYFKVHHGLGTIKGISVIDAQRLLTAARQYLLSCDAFIEEVFDERLLEIKEDGVCYKNIAASNLVCCNGAAISGSRFFQSLPFTMNRGDVLILEIPGLPEDSVYHRTLRLIPKGNHQFWCGSNYQWNFENLLPDEGWRKASEAELRTWLKIPFEVKKHIVAQRPTTAGQVPFVGVHPKYRQLAVLGGLGTRGFSSGPFWAGELAKQLITPGYQMPGYDRGWFEKWLSR